jgi:high-affinity iron transporter
MTVRRFRRRYLPPVDFIGTVLVAAVATLRHGIVLGGNSFLSLTQPSDAAAAFNIGVLVFREGLECVLVLVAITANMTGPQRVYRRPVAFGVGIGFLATLVTWYLAVRILDDLGKNVSALAIQAATRAPRGSCSSLGHELVVSQSLLDRLDVSS